MRQVYRLENALGIGIYGHLYHEDVQVNTKKYLEQLQGLKLENYDEEQLESFYQRSLTHHPNIFDEGFVGKFKKLKKDIDDHFCGFDSLEQMFNWFPLEGLVNMIDNGLYVNIYECEDDDVISSRNQCMFNLEKANRVETFTLEKFVEDNI